MAESTTDETGGDAGRYAAVNGLSMYYDIHGNGPPLVLLHGAFSAIGTSFGKVLPSLARSRRVIAVELQARGHTADIDRPLTIGQMADDTMALLRQLRVENADILGYSMGADIALEIAVRRPALVRRLVLVSTASSRDGLYPGILEGEEDLEPEDMAGIPWQQEYARIARNPGDWPALIEKVKSMDREFADRPADAIRSIAVPTLVIIGDADIVRPEHAVEMLRLLGGGVPGDLAGLPVPGWPCSPGPPTPRSWTGPTG